MEIVKRTSVALCVAASLVAISCTSQPPEPKPAPQTPSANLIQLMRGSMYVNANVIFAAQEDVSKLPQALDASTSPNPLTNTYGGWQAVENAALALAESAPLIAVPGRLCENGNPVPVEREDWMKAVEGLRTTALEAYKAAQTKNPEKMVEIGGSLTDACAACHDHYRDRENVERCVP
jgi:hypothetical protein